MKNLTRSQRIEKFFSAATRKLAIRHASLMQDKEQLPSGTKIAPEINKEIEMIEVELKHTLYRSLSSDVLPIVITTSSEEKKK